MDCNDTLTGRWTGRYDYGDGLGPVPFEATINEIERTLSGEITEPNTFRRDMGGHLAAIIIGTRTGFDVSFRKTYDGFEQGDDPLYAGKLNGALTRIDGTWRFPKEPMWSGRFMMVRAVDARARRRAVAEATL
ncbi:hypothetical protein [Yoonia sp. BS5-3]|uniref:Uncharacterized protein n=1 Tax=Yoonia phaeophyticola TaxID=3137369 RepID=A0ABZ2VBU2_9RHOB